MLELSLKHTGELVTRKGETQLLYLFWEQVRIHGVINELISELVRPIGWDTIDLVSPPPSLSTWMMKGRFVEIAKGLTRSASRIFSFLSPLYRRYKHGRFHWNIVTLIHHREWNESTDPWQLFFFLFFSFFFWWIIPYVLYHIDLHSYFSSVF